MDMQNEKCVIVIDESLPTGIIANTAAILGMTLGKRMPELVGCDTFDRDGREHPGIIEIPLPILKINAAGMRELRTRLYDAAFDGLFVVDFSDLAQSCKVYQEYVSQMADTDERTLAYWGLAVCGDKKKVNKLTGSLPLLR